MNTLPNDDPEIRKILEQEQAAWNAGDADAYSRSFHPEGSFTNIVGDTQFGRKIFLEKHAAIFQTIFRGSRLSLTVRRIFFPVPGTAIVDMDAAVDGYQALPPGVVPPSDGVLHTRLLQVMVKENEAWWVAAYHNVDVKGMPKTNP
jgi:uncharacterized protein (TIGR02246 family)